MSAAEPPRRVPARDLYLAAITRYDDGDVDGFADAHAEDALLVTPGGTAFGRSAIGDYWSRQKAAFPDLRLTLDLVVDQGDVVMSEWSWAGTNTGLLALRDGRRMPATGRRVELRGMEVAQFRDDLIAEYHIYWDGMSLAQQLGLAR